MNLKTNIYQIIKNILETARNNAYKQVNFIMVEVYWKIGQKIVEELQKNIEKNILELLLNKGNNV